MLKKKERLDLYSDPFLRSEALTSRKKKYSIHKHAERPHVVGGGKSSLTHLLMLAVTIRYGWWAENRSQWRAKFRATPTKQCVHGHIIPCVDGRHDCNLHEEL